MSIPRIQLVLNDYVDVGWLCDVAVAGLDGVQIRIRDTSTQTLIDWIERLRIDVPGIDLSINARVDIALALDLPAVHMPSHGLPVADVRRIAPGLRIGRSVHGIAEARQAKADGADVLMFGHVYPSSSHPDVPARGIDALAAVAQAAAIPVIAIGGIAPERVGAVRSAGAQGMAVIGAITTAIDPTKVVATMIEEWKACDSR